MGISRLPFGYSKKQISFQRVNYARQQENARAQAPGTRTASTHASTNVARSFCSATMTVTVSAPSFIRVAMESVVIESRPDADERFDTARITAAVDALAEKHAGREDLFRAAMAQLLKAEL